MGHLEGDFSEQSKPPSFTPGPAEAMAALRAVLLNPHFSYRKALLRKQGFAI